MVCVTGKSSSCLDSWSGSQQKAVTCSDWMRGALSSGLWFEIVFPGVTVSPQSAGWRYVESWLPSFVSSSYFALKDDEKLLENTFSIFLAVSFVAWLPCALVQRITYCSSWMFTFPFCSARMLGSAAPVPNTHSLQLPMLLSSYEFHSWVVLPRNICCVIVYFAVWNRQVDDLQSCLHLFEQEWEWSCPGVSQTHPHQI